jgi:hypothetical protein
MQTLKTYFEQIPVEMVKKIAPLPNNERRERTIRAGNRPRKVGASAVLIQIEADPNKMIKLVERMLQTSREKRRTGQIGQLRAPFGDGFAFHRRKRMVMSPYEPTQEEWRELACLASVEEDPYKVVELARQIVEKYDEEQRSTTYAKVKKRKLERVLERINARNPPL